MSDPYVPKRPWSHCRPDEAETSFAIAQATKPNALKVIWSGFKFLCGGREKSFVANRVQAEGFARERFARLLREPFHGLTDKQIARAWAKQIGTSERTIENWLACTHSASITDMVIVSTTHGIFQTMAIFVGEDTRAEVMDRIGRR